MTQQFNPFKPKPSPLQYFEVKVIMTYPQQAASTIAIQKASVSDVLMSISPCTNTCNHTIYTLHTRDVIQAVKYICQGHQDTVLLKHLHKTEIYTHI